MQIFAIVIFYFASKLAFAPGKNWYYPQDKIQNPEPNNVDVWKAFQERKWAMPYISQEDRIFFDQKISFNNNAIQTPGELNYIITKLIDYYISTHGKNYAIINEVVGVLECAKLELYRRIASPYEDIKIEQNGDVYTV